MGLHIPEAAIYCDGCRAALDSGDDVFCGSCAQDALLAADMNAVLRDLYARLERENPEWWRWVRLDVDKIIGRVAGAVSIAA